MMTAVGWWKAPTRFLPSGRSTPGLPADRRVDLGDQRGRHLDDPDAAQVDGGEEAGRVAERAATDRHERLRALDAEGGQFASRHLDDLETLGRLALGQQDVDDLATACAQIGRQPLADRRPGARLADQDRPAGAHRVQFGAERVGRDPVAEHESSDRRRRSQQRGARLRPIRPPELRLDGVDHAVDLGDARLMDVGGAVEPFALGGQVAQRPDRVATGDQRPDVRGAAQALGEDLGAAIEPDGGPAAVERPSVARIDDGAATGRDHAPDVGRWVGRAEVDDGRAFERSECGLAVLGEDVRDGATGRRLDPLVEVDQRRAVAVRQSSPDDRLATPREPDEDDVHRVSVVPAGAGLVGAGQAVTRGHRLHVGVTGRRPGAWPVPARRPPATGASGVAAMRAR